MTYVPAALRREVIERAGNRCEYCRLPAEIAFYPHEVHHLPDPEVLAQAAREGRILVSHDRRTLPGHSREFVASQTSPGLTIVSQRLPVGSTAELLRLLWAAGEAEEYTDVVYDLP